ncbi:hypothetical protein RE628_26925 [Paenibacillus sp. D2_2]|nr:hypothetical protein [Paenibacillus sp. D2_2]WMT40717.1 hypothetical protein RE628_26925 [Paenibacillus sp. D2_2]
MPRSRGRATVIVLMLNMMGEFSEAARKLQGGYLVYLLIDIEVKSSR